MTVGGDAHLQKHRRRLEGAGDVRQGGDVAGIRRLPNLVGADKRLQHERDNADAKRRETPETPPRESGTGEDGGGVE